MKKGILKVTTVHGYSICFEEYCKEHGIPYKKYPYPLNQIFKVECKLNQLKEADLYIESVEDMPEITVD